MAVAGLCLLGLILELPAARAQTPGLRITVEPLPDGVSGRAYSTTLRATGGEGALEWRVQSGQLPPSLRLESKSGEIHGLPIAQGIWEATIEVRDTAGHKATGHARIRIALPLVLETRALPAFISSSAYRFVLLTTGGIQPLHFDIVAGGLPRGLFLDNENGFVYGQSSELGPFTVTVRVTDSARPRAQSAERTYTTRVLGPLNVDWTTPPAVRDNGIYGSLRVSNATQDNLNLTVIVVAVNEYGKAFSLGYQHFVLKPASESQEIPFGFSLPRGTYMARVDAVGEIPEKNVIQRAYRETAGLSVD